MNDSEELRAARLRAYRLGEYTMSVPPTPTLGWSEHDWCNWVQFNDPKLTGWLPAHTKEPPPKKMSLEERDAASARNSEAIRKIKL